MNSGRSLQLPPRLTHLSRHLSRGDSCKEHPLFAVGLLHGTLHASHAQCHTAWERGASLWVASESPCKELRLVFFCCCLHSLSGCCGAWSRRPCAQKARPCHLCARAPLPEDVKSSLLGATVLASLSTATCTGKRCLLCQRLPNLWWEREKVREGGVATNKWHHHTGGGITLPEKSNPPFINVPSQDFVSMYLPRALGLGAAQQCQG